MCMMLSSIKGPIIYPPGHACDLENKEWRSDEVCMRGVVLVKAEKMFVLQSCRWAVVSFVNNGALRSSVYILPGIII